MRSGAGLDASGRGPPELLEAVPPDDPLDDDAPVPPPVPEEPPEPPDDEEPVPEELLAPPEEEPELEVELDEPEEEELEVEDPPGEGSGGALVATSQREPVCAVVTIGMPEAFTFKV